MDSDLLSVHKQCTTCRLGLHGLFSLGWCRWPPLTWPCMPKKKSIRTSHLSRLEKCLCCACLCGAVFRDKTQRHHHLWSCHTFKPLHLPTQHLGVKDCTFARLIWIWVAMKVAPTCCLLSSLSGGARRPALGNSHYLGDVGLGSGFFSHWQHSLHCNHGKRRLRDCFNFTLEHIYVKSHTSTVQWERERLTK